MVRTLTNISIFISLLLSVAPAQASMLHFAAPLSTTSITSGYGERINPVTGQPDFHAGLDLAAKLNQPVMSIDDGTVVKAGPRGLLGNAVEIVANGTSAIYGHLNKVLVTAGESVKQGQVIGLAGSTGRSTGPHVHLAIKRDGKLLNPIAFLGGTLPRALNSVIAEVRHVASPRQMFGKSSLRSMPEMAVKYQPPRPSKSEIQSAQVAFKQAEETSKTYSDLYNEGAVSRNEAEQRQQLAQAAKARLSALTKAAMPS